MTIGMTKKPLIAAVIAAVSLGSVATTASARPHHRSDDSGITLQIGPGGVSVDVHKDRAHDHGPRDHRRAERRERRDVVLAERRLTRERRELNRAIARGARPAVIRKERRDVREARLNLRRERRDLR